MTIRSNIDAREANRIYTAFEEGCANAPAGTFAQAEKIRLQIGEACDSFLANMKALGVAVCNCDGIREIEVLMFDMLRRKNQSTGPIMAATAFGLALQEQRYQSDRDEILRRVKRDGYFAATRDDWIRYGLEADVGKPSEPNFVTEEHALREGEGDLWAVRVRSSRDDFDWVDLEVRATTPKEAAERAEKHAAKFPDIYFDTPRDPTYHADRDNIYRVDDDEEPVIDDDPDRFPGYHERV